MPILCIIDGMSDGPDFEYNQYPNLVSMAEQGSYGLFDTTPCGFLPESMACILTLLGLKAEQIPKLGRAYFEAVGADIPISPDDLVLRCSLGKLDENGILVSPCAGNLTYQQAEQLGVINLGGYKNLLVLHGCADKVNEVVTHAPHENIGKPIEELLPHGLRLKGFVLESRRRLNPYVLLPWGQARRTHLPAFPLKAAAVCKTEIVRGIAKAMGFYTPEVPHATSDVDTDLTGKVSLALKLSQSYDFVLLHINGADEASHRQNSQQKQAFLHRIDKEVFSVLRVQNNVPVLVASDHSSSPVTGQHGSCPQPFVLYNTFRRGNLGLHQGNCSVELLNVKEKKP